MEETIQEQMRRDTINSLDLNLKQFMKIVEPVNFTSKLSRWKADKKWLEEGGISKMLNKLKDIMIAVEYLKDVKKQTTNADKANTQLTKPHNKISDDYQVFIEEEIEFLENSNWIEKEYSDEAMEDSIEAWKFARQSIINGSDIDIQMIKLIHKRLMQRLNKRIAGKIRTCPIYVGNRIEYRECLKPELINEELEKWCKSGNIKFLHSPKDRAVENINKIHVEFEKIHPFEDGNGRVGRILLNIQRIRSCMSILIIHEGREQYEYYKWFKEDSPKN